MVDCGLSFLSDIIPNIINKETIVDTILMRIVVLYGPNLLSCQKDSCSIKEEIKAMLG